MPELLGNGRPWPGLANLKPLSWQNLVTSGNLISHHSGDGTLEDSSAAARHLAQGSGSQNITYTQGVGGQRAIMLGGQQWLDLANPAHNADYRLTGAYTLIAIINLMTTGACFLASCDSTSDADADDNMLWGCGIAATTFWSATGHMYPMWEYGDRVDYSYGANGNIAIPRYQPCAIAMKRAINGAGVESQYMVNGVNCLNSPRVETGKNPAGGANAILRVGADTYGPGNKWIGTVQSLILADNDVADEALREEFQRCGFYQPTT